LIFFTSNKTTAWNVRVPTSLGLFRSTRNPYFYALCYLSHKIIFVYSKNCSLLVYQNDQSVAI